MPTPYNGLTALGVQPLPVSLAEVKRHLRLIDDDSQDDELTAKVRYATEFIEDVTGHVGASRQYRMTMARWPMMPGNAFYINGYANAPLELPRFPVLTVDSVNYVDTDGVTRAYTGFQLSTDREPAIILPARLGYYPQMDPYTADAITITFTAGYATVPERYKEAVKFLAAYRFLNRESDAGGKMPDSLRTLVTNLGNGWQG